MRGVQSRDTTVLLSVLDIVDMMKDKGIITIRKHTDSIELLKKYKLERSNSLESSSRRLMFDWNALQMLEECDVLDELQRLSDQRYIGPFSYAVIKSDVNRYETIDKIQKALKSLEEIIAGFIEDGKIKLIPSITKKPSYDPLEYIKEINRICREGDYLLWTDDLALNVIASSEGIKTTGTRTALDILLAKKMISEDFFIHNTTQLLKWNMHFCWINSEIIFKCAEMYSYSKSEDLNIFIKALTDEIKNIPDHLPNSIEQSNFLVASLVIQKLWQVSDKSRTLGMKIFDELHDVVKLKDNLRVFWISQCIIDMALWGEMPLSDFLIKLSFRMTGHIDDEFKGILRGLIAHGLSRTSAPLFQKDQNLIVVANIIKAVKVAIPGYRDELLAFAIKRDPALRALL